MEFIRSILALNLLEIRKSHGSTQSDIANALQTTTPTYNRWENGQSWPDADSLERLAAFYGIRSTRFFYDPSLGDIPPSRQTPSNKEIIKDLQAIIDKLS